MILTDCFSNTNFSKAQIARSLMMVIKPKHVRAFFNVNFNISFKAKTLVYQLVNKKL